jgi:hypothetical protein
VFFHDVASLIVAVAVLALLVVEFSLLTRHRKSTGHAVADMTCTVCFLRQQAMNQQLP